MLEAFPGSTSSPPPRNRTALQSFPGLHLFNVLSISQLPIKTPKMKALQFPRVNQTEIVSLEKPSISAREVLVRVGASGICHTDIEILNGNYGANFPVIPGHEFAGTVEQVGKEA